MSRANRFEEILEECVSAHLEGRRSLEQSLSLYPALRSELEPLLRTTIGLRSTLQQTVPAPAAQQRGLARFLSDARARRNLKTFRRQTATGWLAELISPKYRLGLGTLAAGVAVVAIAVGMAGLDTQSNGNGGDGPDIVQPPPSVVETPAAVRNVQIKLDSIRDRLSRGETLQASEIADLDQAISELESIDAGDDAVSQVFPVLQAADDLLDEIATQPAAAPDLVAAVDDASETTRDVAGGIGLDLDATDTPTAVAEPTTPAVEPTTPTIVDTPVPTAPPTEAPTPELPTAIPTPTVDGREPAPIP